jgi:PadR family transcriptional regulator, regulatory protein AphA
MPESPSSHRARSPEYALLGFLYSQPGHGYELQRLLTSELGQIWHVNQSQTYAILKRLETQGYICATTVAQEKLPAIQRLQITPAGRRRFTDWLETASGSSVRAIRLEFITRLYFAQKLFPESIPTILELQTSQVQHTLARLEASLTALPAEQKFNILGLQLRIQQLKSILDWLGECRQAF